MATLKEFEDALRQHGMTNALAILDGLKKRDREQRSIAPARRVVGRKMTAELARSILDLHATTGMTQQEIAFKLGVNQGRVNEVIKRGKWLSTDPNAPEVLSRDKAMERLAQRARARRTTPSTVPVHLSPAPENMTAPVQSESKGSARVTNERVPSPPALPFGPASRRDQPANKPKERPPLARSADAPTPIVSAQLAFLDL